MAKFYLLAYFTVVFTGWSPALGEENQVNIIRVPRTLKNKLCQKHGLCGHQGGYNNHQGGYNNHQGGYGSHQEGYGGHQGGYSGHQGGFYPYPPINIGISQSQSSASAGGGGFGSSSYPNNYQYNGGYPNHGYNGHKRPSYFGNGFGSYNNQFNGNYYGGKSGHGGGGYGFQRPFEYYDASNEDYGDYNSRSAKNKD